MNWIDTLERRFGRYAIPGLVKLIVALNALVFILIKLNPAFYNAINLSAEGLARHEYWRIVTFLFIPQTQSFLWILFALMFLWMLGDGLEQAMGPFRLNLFYLVGMIGTTVAAIFFGADFSNTMLNLSLLFAFAWYFPDLQIFFMLIIPMKIRWVAWISAAFVGFGMLGGSGSYRMAVLASLANYFLFFGPAYLANARQQQKTAARRRKFTEASIPEDEPLHRCANCGRTEEGHPQLEFRVSSRDGHEYCLEHLPKPGEGGA